MSSSMFLLLGAGLLFAALALALSVVGVVTTERRLSGQTLAALKAVDAPEDLIADELQKPFSERIVAPLGERMVGIGHRLTRDGTNERLQHKLDIAGNPSAWTVNRLIGLKALGLMMLGAVVAMYSFGGGLPFGRVVLLTALGGSLGYFLPNILLNNAGQKREHLMLNSLPDAIDLLTISVEAGLGFDAALGRVAKETKGPLASEFARLLQEMQIGVGRMEAMRAMAERTSLKDFKSFCLAMVQADAFGIGISDVLRVQSAEMRAKRRTRAEEKAQQIPVKLLFPLIFFVMPTLFIVLLGPVVLQVMATFGGGK